jgi:hemerythrin
MRDDAAPTKAAFQRFFEGWIIRHIMDADAKFGKFMNEKGVF